MLQHNSIVLWTNTVHKSDFENAPQRWSLFAQTKGNRKFSHLGQKHAQNMFLEKLCLSSWCIFKFVFFLSKSFSFTTHTVQVVSNFYALLQPFPLWCLVQDIFYFDALFKLFWFSIFQNFSFGSGKLETAVPVRSLQLGILSHG